MRFHLPSLPHTQTTDAYSWCAYTSKVKKFADMMTSLGHEVFLYAGEGNDAACTELVTVVTRNEQDEWFGHLDWQRDLFPEGGWDPNAAHWRVMNERVIREITRRAEPDDILGLIMGWDQQAIATAFPYMLPTEWGVGYEGICTAYRVFESYAWMHHVYGIKHDSSGYGNDTVIPNSFDADEFPLGAGDGGYYLFIGRVTPRKGPHIAAQVCQEIGARLVVAGQGVWKQEPGRLFGLEGMEVACDNIEYAGVVGPAERARLIGGAIAVFVPTIYIEPFGGVAIESMLCGTPVITTDWGAFTETVIEGETGYRCRWLGDFIEGARRAPSLDRAAIRSRALRYSTDVVRHEYDAYFRRLLTLRDDPTSHGRTVERSGS